MSKNMKLIMEAWADYIGEDEDMESPAEDASADIMEKVEAMVTAYSAEIGGKSIPRTSLEILAYLEANPGETAIGQLEPHDVDGDLDGVGEKELKTALSSLAGLS
tara:strand:+ start:1742 stop:2056 length:315 start_codon:yes stop_codon:yes gene_type:complete